MKLKVDLINGIETYGKGGGCELRETLGMKRDHQ